MTMWIDNYKHLADVWKNPTTDGIISKLQDKSDIPWKNANIPQVLDLTYYYNHSGDKIVSPLIDNMLGDSDTLTEEQKQTLTDLVYDICNENWKRVWLALFSDYNPIWNTDATITETGNDSNTGKQNGTNNTAHKGSDVHTIHQESSDTKGGSDKVEHNGSNTHDISDDFHTVNDHTTDKDTKNGDELHEKTGVEITERTGNEEDKKEGVEITSKSGKETTSKLGKETTSKLGKETVTKSGTETNTKTGNEISTKSGEEYNQKDGTEFAVNKTVDADDGKSKNYTTTKDQVFGYNSDNPADDRMTRVENHVNNETITEYGKRGDEGSARRDTVSFGTGEKARKDTLSFGTGENARKDQITFDKRSDTTDYGSGDNARKDVLDYGTGDNARKDVTDYGEGENQRKDTLRFGDGTDDGARKDTHTYNNVQDKTTYGDGGVPVTEKIRYENFEDTHTIDHSLSDLRQSHDNNHINIADTTTYNSNEGHTLDNTDTVNYNSNQDVTIDITNTNNGEHHNTTTRQGNIGVTTTQQMITEEIQLRKEMFYELVFSDIDRYLTIEIY